jgi:hypothetical protein
VASSWFLTAAQPESKRPRGGHSLTAELFDGGVVCGGNWKFVRSHFGIWNVGSRKPVDF